jgi:quercetin 2,3-dioxygenase
VEHGDSMGNKGIISSGDIQWMTAGNGIIHQEMPKGAPDGSMYGFQLWANLPKSQKMMAPRYREVKSDQIPEVSVDNGTRIRVICGNVGDMQGPVRDIVIDPEYLDIAIPAGSNFSHPTKRGHTVLAYVIEGKGYIGKGNMQQDTLLSDGDLILFGDGDQVTVSTKGDPIRLLLISGKPIGEPIAWHGPIVMNTEEELRTAFEDLNNGTFVKQQKSMRSGRS